MMLPATRTILVLAVVTAVVPALAIVVTSHGGSGADGSTPRPVTLRLDPVADSYTDAQHPHANYGSYPRANALDETSTAFLKFDIPRTRTPRPKLSRAYLELYTTNLAVSSGGVRVSTAANDWSEKTLTAADVPLVDSTALGPAVRPRTHAYVRIRLADLAGLHLGRQLSLALSYSEPQSRFQFATRESAHPPVLVLDFGTPTATSRAAGSAPFHGSVAFAGGRTRPRRDNPALPFNWPSTTRKRASHRLVFAHYFTPYPRSLDNRPARRDYYAQVYLKPTGSTAAYGGVLRDRPLGRRPLSGRWQLRDMEFEVRAAIASGINGWTLDLLSPEGSNWDRDRLMMRAAHDVDPSFKVMLMPDMTASFGHLSVRAMAVRLARLASAPAAFHLADGRLVLSPFEAQLWSPATWSQLMSLLRSRYGVRTAFVPTFLYAAPSYLRTYASISYGFSDWGTRSPLLSEHIAHDIGVVHSTGKLWMQTIAAQDARPDQSSYFEADNLAELRDSWHQTIEGGADWVQLATWNDFSESTDFAPSVAHGYSLLDVSSYYAAEFETGHVPVVSRDALYLTERDQFTTAQPRYPETALMRLRTPGSPARNRVEVQSFLTEPARVTIRVGSHSYSYDAPAGVSHHDVPLGYGAVTARARVHGRLVSSVEAARPVVARPYTQDLQYHAASSRREAQR